MPLPWFQFLFVALAETVLDRQAIEFANLPLSTLARERRAVGW